MNNYGPLAQSTRCDEQLKAIVYMNDSRSYEITIINVMKSSRLLMI